MDQLCFLQNAERVQQLFRKDSDQTQAETSERILFDQFVQVARK